MNYKIHNYIELGVALTLVFLYVIFLLFISKFKTINKTLDISIYVDKFNYLFKITPLLTTITNCVLLILLVILYIFLISSLMKLIKKILLNYIYILFLLI
jgi:hypothetical protein